mmetsp:Transcript_13576/g.24545  ORF Transcript_13576/g.24545 Transcript_13576/m.24545 type:complete len:742 (-) Transcript_13576:137-2362(-)
MMESTLVTDGSDPNSGGLSTNMNGNSLFGGDDNELFGPPPTTMTGGTTTNGGSKSDLMGQLLGESAEIKPSSIPAAPSNNVTVSAPSVAPVVVTSKLSTSGLLESSSSGLFGDDDDGAGGGGGGSGLFDDVDAEAERKERQQRMEAADALAQQKMQEEQRRQREAELAQQLQLGSQQQQFQQNISMESNVDIMHELNLNDNNGEFMGMGMGLGGEIPKSPPPAAAPPMPAQYQQYPYQPPPPQQQQQQQQQQGVMNAMAGSYYYSTTGAGQMTGQPTQTATARRQHAPPQPSVLAGMHVGHDVNLGGVAPPPAGTAAHSPSKYHSGQANNFPPAPSAITNYVPAAPFDPRYGRIVVNDPMLIQGSGLFAGPPHWTYLVTVHSKNAKSPQKQSQPQPPLSAVRRRFRHFVALEDRLRTSVPGAILPPRPDKHPARAIEEATARQSSDFAQQRSNELSVYMNALVHHPHAGLSPEVKLFLTLQDHIGTAWPEVSSSAFTRMTAVGTATVEKLTDTMDGMLSELGTAQQVAAGEDSAEILALAAYEGRRIGAVSSSVPKVEGAVGLIRDRSNEQISEGRGVVRSRSRHAHGGIVERLATKRTTDQTPRIGIGGGGRTLHHPISQLSLRTNGVCGSQVGVETPHRGAYQSRWTCRQIDDESNLHAKHGKARYVGTDGDRGGHVRRDGNRGWEGGGGGGIEVADGGWEDWRDTREGVGFEYEGDCERDEGGLCGECGGLGKCVGGV